MSLATFEISDVDRSKSSATYIMMFAGVYKKLTALPRPESKQAGGD